MFGKILFTVGAATVGLAVGTAAPALADENDDIFISVIDDQGIP
jgi:hypothetical protein